MSDARTALAEQFRSHFGHRDNLYASLLTVLADDLQSGGVTLAIVRDRLDASRDDVVHLRLLAGVQRIVMRGEAPDLAPFYEQPTPAPQAADVAPAFLGVLTAHEDELRAALDSPPQTNEAGRSAVLLVGLFEAVRRHGLDRIRLLEPGASAGLNLNVDRYRFFGPDWTFGPPDSALAIEVPTGGINPEQFTIVERRGCDLAPVAVDTPEGAAYLASFTWPFDTDRRARLSAALEIARAHPPRVDRAPASAWLAEQLEGAVDERTLTVVWQSITRQYWPESESAAVDAAIDAARARLPIARITMEGVPPADVAERYTIAEHGAELRVDGELLARSHHHGPPIVLL